MNSTKGLGPVAAIGIAVALLVMLTLLPALLVIFGRWVFWPRAPDVRLRRPHRDRRLGAGRPRIARAAAADLGRHVAACWRSPSLGVLQLDANGLANKDAFYGTPDSVVGEQVLAGTSRPAPGSRSW